MMKLLFWVALVGLVAFIWGMRQGARQRRRAAQPPASAPSAQALLRCAHCGAHIPAAGALRRGAAVYCSPEHRDADTPVGP